MTDDNLSNHDTNEVAQDNIPGRRDLGNGLWITSFREEFIKQPAETRALLPDDHDFWLNPSWCFGSSIMATALLVSTEDQAATMRTVNEAIASAGLQVIPTWGPSELAVYLGDLHIVFGEDQLARFISAVFIANASALEMGAKATMQRLSGLTTLQPVSMAALLSIFMAREVIGKNLLTCTDEELVKVNEATGKLLLATGTANARPFTAAELPKALIQDATPRDVSSARPDLSTGQYL